ncbi:MAG: hypothetical protein ACLGI5_06120 [Thermoleophilia bacterium]
MVAQHLDREIALTALRRAAEANLVPVAELTTFNYRALRGQPRNSGEMPSDFAISVLFGSWQRACELAARSAARERQPRDPQRGIARRATAHA